MTPPFEKCRSGEPNKSCGSDERGDKGDSLCTGVRGSSGRFSPPDNASLARHLRGLGHRLNPLGCAFLLCLFLVSEAFPAEKAKKPNILFIAIDDLRPELGCYGSPAVISPNLDKLASEGRRFARAYCQEAICAPSRASIMTGARPDTTGITHNYVKIRELNPDIVTMPQHFAAHGYETFYTGKIYHQGDDDEHAWSRDPDPSKLPFKRLKKPYALEENLAIHQQNKKEMIAKYGEAAKRGLGTGPAYESADVADHVYKDGFNTELGIATMKEVVAEGDKPFFMALGFHLPHLNWVAPKKYWDLYDRDELALATQTEGPEGGAAVGLHASFELRTRHGIPKSGPLGDDLSRTLLHAYYACVSYVDAQIGKAIAALEEAGVRDDTIIIVWSDHGWHLGEMGIWGKATNYEIATRVPMIAWTPEMKHPGEPTNALVELVDIFPTLCELSGVPPLERLEGRSFAPLLENPDQPWKKIAISQFPSPALREWAANPLSPEMRETYFGPLISEVETRIQKQQGDAWDRELFEQHLMGYSVRSDRYRLVLWRDQRNPEAKPVFVELFDHENDPNETVNVADSHPEIVSQLHTDLAETLGW
ncbi:MAG: sulfatase [Verrucomicrobiales bacterium]|nr:sulfatase [Verrucomicrobiales bacterium]